MEKGDNILDCEFIKSTYKNYYPEKEYNIVFALNHVVCFPSNEEEEIEVSYYAKEALHIYCNIHSFSYSYFFYPHFGELFLEILSLGWNISFYSGQDSKQCQSLIREFFLKFLKKYMSKPEKLYDKLVLEDRLSIFSSNNFNSTFTTSCLQTGFDIENFYKIDISKITNQPNNTIIVTENRSLILGANYPFIALDKNSSVNFSRYFELILEKLELGTTKNFPKEYLEQNYTPLNNAYYIMGILENIKNLIKTGKAHFLRQALDKVIHNISYYQNQNNISIYETPWYLSPLPHINPKSNMFIKLGKRILKEWNQKIKMAS